MRPGYGYSPTNMAVSSRVRRPGGHNAGSTAAPQDFKLICLSKVKSLTNIETNAMRTMNLTEAAGFLHMHPEEVRSRAKRGLIPGAKIGRKWVFL